MQRERSVSRLKSEFRELGVEMSDDDENVRSIYCLITILTHFLLFQTHYTKALDQGIQHPPLKRKREDSEGRVRSSSKIPRDESGIRDVTVCRTHLNLSRLLSLNIFSL